ncbi:MAG: SusD/RagB family nutrient-binding outer membrane lipoprotein [Bacteroidales bacterium]|nr:MAG: SusD/RagB family nutrient-binding outer membrane lipoprotein [Bacteroidales bacterium]
MKTKIYLTILMAFGLFSCSDLEEMNINPDKPSPELNKYDYSRSKVSTLLRAGSTYNGAHIFQRLKSLHIDLYSQMLDEVPSGWTNTRNYFSNDGWTIDYWNIIPSWISSLNIVINQGKDDPDRVNSVAVSKIWRVYIQSQACDVFGVMPFPSYKQIVENPPYVSVQDQYLEFFTELDEAIKMIDPAKGFLNGKEDMIYEGDITKWKKFANSLRLRLALRVSEVNPSLCATQAQAAIAIINGGTMESSGDDAKCPPSNKGWGQDYNYTLLFGWGETQHMTSSFEKLVTNIGGIDWPLSVSATTKPAKIDPRAVVMFDPSSSGIWKGVTPGLHPNNVNQSPNAKTEIAILGEFIVGKPAARNISRDYDLMLYEEVCFLKAEAALRGFATGNAKTEYEAGIHVSFTRWGVSGAEAYILSNDKNTAGTSANFDDISGTGNTQLEKIITQKYISLFPDVSIEAWSDKRRLNLPRFDVLAYRDPLIFGSLPSDITDPRSFIKRVKIPNAESTNNAVEYEKGVILMGTGGDRTSTNLWWDINKNYCTSAI